MPDFSKIATNALNLLNPAKSPGKTLMALNAIGIAFAAASNTFAAATDKNTSPEDKKFLVPAGGATGVANIAIYLGMTSKLVDKLSSDGKYKNSGFANKVIQKMVDMGTFDKNADKFISSKIAKMSKKETPEFIAEMTKTLKKDGVLTERGKELYKESVKNGLGVAGAFIGAVVGCAIITPILRDVSAYFVQKAREAKNPSLKDKPYRPYFDISHIRAGKYPYGKPNYQPVTFKTYENFTSGRIKV